MNWQQKLLIFLVLALVLALSTSVFAQQGTIIARKTADPLMTGYARWIKIQIKGPTDVNNNLNDQFAGMEFAVDLNVDGDFNDSSNPGDVVTVNGSEIVTTPPGVPGGAFDDTIYLPIKAGTTTPYPYDTNLRPRVWLKNSGALRIGPFGLSILIDSGYFPCDDAIPPMIREAAYYDDGTGHAASGTGYRDNMTPFDGYIDRIDLVWSEPMDSTNITATPAIFLGLGSTIYDYESIGAWYTISGRWQRFTFWVRSASPNTGIAPIMTYQQPASVTDRFKEAPTSQNKAYAESHSRALTDRAGPAIISAHTKRATRRQPLANALASKRIEVTFSEPVAYTTVGASDFIVHTLATSPLNNNITSIISPTSGSSSVYEFQLTTNYLTGNETGDIVFSAAYVVSDVVSNYNGNSNAPEQPTQPTPSAGATINIFDGIYPNIIQVTTLDAVLPGQLTSGGLNGWGYLDYVDVYFDHDMSSARVSTAGLAVTGDGILTIGGTGTWVSSTVLRVPLTATTPKLANTGVVPLVSYTNPGNPNGLVDVVSSGLVENLLTSDIFLSSSNGLAVQVRDFAPPAIVRALTAGTKRIRITFSEKVNTTGWPTTAAIESPSRFKWVVGSSYFDISGTFIYYTGLSPARRDSVIYLNHTGLAWTKSDSGAINFALPSLVYDVATSANGNQQYDDDNSLSSPVRALVGSDVKASRDNIPPILLRLQTEDIDHDGKLDHYRCVFDDLSPIYPRRSFKSAFWSIIGYDGPKSSVGIDLNVYNSMLPMIYQPTAINAFGDTVEAWIRFDETTGIGPVLTPYGGDTGDVPDVIVTDSNGFTDWADNPMAPLVTGLTFETDHAGPAIMFAKTVDRTQVETFMSEDLDGSSIQTSDFNLVMTPNATPLFAVPLSEAQEVSPGKVLLTTLWEYARWSPKSEGYVFLNDQDVIYDVASPSHNGNDQDYSVPVISNTACRFDVHPVLPGSQVQGVPFEVEVVARDKYGNIDANFDEYLVFASNLLSNQVSLPSGPQQLTEGIGRFKVISWITTENLRLSVSVPNDAYPVDANGSDAISVIAPVIDAPAYLTVMDFPSDQGGKVTLIWPYSHNQKGMGGVPEINHYEVFWKFNSDTLLHYWGNVFAYNVTGLTSSVMTIDVNLDYSDTTTFYVRAVWLPPTASVKGGGSLTATAPSAYAKYGSILAYDEESGESNAIPAETLSSATTGAVVSGSAIGKGRAIDNIPPMAPALLTADKIGAAVKLHWPKVTKGINGTLERLNVVQYEVFAHPTNAYFNPNSEGALLATVADTSYMINSGGLRQFYVVRAIDTDNQSGLSRRVGKYGFNLVTAAKTKYNYLSLPLETAITNARELAQAVGSGIKVVMQLDGATNGYSKYYLVDLNYPTPPLALHTGMPVMVQADSKAPATWFYSGNVPAANTLQFHLNKNFKSSYNEIILPLDKVGVTNAEQLAQDIGGVDVVLKLGADGTGFSQYWLPSIRFGNPMTPFTIQPGEAVMIQVNKTAPAIWPNYTN